MDTPAWVTEKYIRLLSPFLHNFKKSQKSWKFNCPFCSDKRQRGYIYFRNRDWWFYCQNESAGRRFENLLKELNPALHLEYRKEILKASAKPVEQPKAEPEERVFNLFKDLRSIADLDNDHPARLYVAQRQIPEKHFKRLYYAPKFKKFCNSIIPDKFTEQHDEPRLVIPCIDSDLSVIGFTGRSFDPSAELRYISIALGERRLIFGLDRVDTKKHCYVVEGPIDSLFLPNCIAAGGSAIRQVMGPNKTAVFDNEPRNKEICKLMEMAIDSNMRIVIWPSNMRGKDINDFIKNGISVKEILGIISENSYDGLIAKVKFGEWRLD